MHRQGLAAMDLSADVVVVAGDLGAFVGLAEEPPRVGFEVRAHVFPSREPAFPRPLKGHTHSFRPA
jgi:hypothetical protein